MPKDRRRKLQIYWQGGWRTILENTDRKPLVEYAETCPEKYDLRIIDSEEEVKARGRHH